MPPRVAEAPSAQQGAPRGGVCAPCEGVGEDNRVGSYAAERKGSGRRGAESGAQRDCTPSSPPHSAPLHRHCLSTHAIQCLLLLSSASPLVSFLVTPRPSPPFLLPSAPAVHARLADLLLLAPHEPTLHARLADLLLLAAHEPSAALAGVQQRVHGNVPALVALKADTLACSREAEFAGADVADCHVIARSMTAGGPASLQRMLARLAAAKPLLPSLRGAKDVPPRPLPSVRVGVDVSGGRQENAAGKHLQPLLPSLRGANDVPPGPLRAGAEAEGAAALRAAEGHALPHAGGADAVERGGARGGAVEVATCATASCTVDVPAVAPSADVAAVTPSAEIAADAPSADVAGERVADRAAVRRAVTVPAALLAFINDGAEDSAEDAVIGAASTGDAQTSISSRLFRLISPPGLLWQSQQPLRIKEDISEVAHGAAGGNWIRDEQRLRLEVWLDEK
ncbi:unnamed protein product [Closterium sp. Yama58-4]|nr:unnamed protein product [Closterium sp. Yama58-4]